MSNDVSNMILDGSLECAAIDVDSGEMLYKFSENSNHFDVINENKYFFYDQLKEFFIIKDNESEDK